MTSQVVLLTAKYFATKQNQTFLGDFVLQLLPNGGDSRVLPKIIRAGHETATLIFVQFVQLPKGTAFNKNLLSKLWKRKLACSFPPGHSGADHLVPYQLASGELSYVMVQTKNKGNSETSKAAGKLNRAFVFGAEAQNMPGQCVRVLFELRATVNANSGNKGPIKGTDTDVHACLVLACRGLEFRCVNDKLNTALGSFLETETDVSTFLESLASDSKKQKVIPLPSSASAKDLKEKLPFVL